ncbi:MAG: ABC transporter permease subunit, partial [Methanomicrobium sp.]|nr:ABC transporter permease subunit [Methanomicrobium sp.]
MQILKNKSLIIGMIFFMGIFGSITSFGTIMSIVNDGQGNIAASLGTLIMYVVLVMGVFTGYFFSAQAFLREKTEGTIETMLCSPLSLKDIWLGKVIGVTIPAYAVTILIAAILIAISNIEADIVFLPSPAMILYFIIVVPVYIGCAVGLLGFVQLLLGMKENQIINIIMIFGFLLLLSVFDALISDEVIFFYDPRSNNFNVCFRVCLNRGCPLPDRIFKQGEDCNNNSMSFFREDDIPIEKNKRSIFSPQKN